MVSSSTYRVSVSDQSINEEGEAGGESKRAGRGGSEVGERGTHSTIHEPQKPAVDVVL